MRTLPIDFLGFLLSAVGWLSGFASTPCCGQMELRLLPLIILRIARSDRLLHQAVHEPF